MANAKRASMREGPLAALFRKTEDEKDQPSESRRPAGQAAAVAPEPSPRALAGASPSAIRARAAPPAHPR